MRCRRGGRTWRSFNHRQRALIDAQLAAGDVLRCPDCACVLEAEPSTRLTAVLPRGATGFDLACRQCRRFLARVYHSTASRKGERLRRLAAAVLRA